MHSAGADFRALVLLVGYYCTLEFSLKKPTNMQMQLAGFFHVSPPVNPAEASTLLYYTYYLRPGLPLGRGGVVNLDILLDWDDDHLSGDCRTRHHGK